MKLYIIGNGFDLWHGLPTGYDQFYEFAKELLDDIENYYSFNMSHSGPWSDFENSLGRFEWEYFYEAYNHTDVSSDSFKPSEVYGLEDEITDKADSYVEAVKESFREWIEGIDISEAQKKMSFPENAKFLTFNYTSTLQCLYGISGEEVFHVHGQADKSELIFGHAETREEEPDFDEDGEPTRHMFSDAQGAAKYPFYAFQKPVSEVIESNDVYFNSIRETQKIIVIGHSFNDVDLPYFKKIADNAKNAEWLVCYYMASEKLHFVQKLVGCGVKIERISTCSYADL